MEIQGGKEEGGSGNGEFDSKITAALMCSISRTQKFADIYLTNKKIGEIGFSGSL